MFRNYLAAALRNLVRNKLYAVINIVGLTVAFAAALFIALFIRDERSFETWMPHHERTYLLRVSGKPSPEAVRQHRDSSPIRFADWLTAAFPQVERTARLGFARNGVPGFRTGIRHGEIEDNEILYWADPGFLSVVALPIVAGDPATALQQADGVVLTRRMARKYFGRDDPIGEPLELDRQHVMQVTAVIEDLPTNTHLNFDFLASGLASFSGLKREEAIPIPASATGYRIGAYTYFRLAPGAAIADVEAGLPAMLDQHGFVMEGRKSGLTEVSAPSIASLHLSPGGDNNYLMRPRGNPGLLTTLSTIAALLIAIAAINFVNLMTARAARRAVEVGVRKVSGAMRRQLAVQFLGESAVYVVIGSVLAASAVQLLLPAFNAALQRTSVALNFWQDPGFAAAVVCIGVCMSLLAGLYPALVLPSFTPAIVLKGGANQTVGSALVRRALVVIQFAILIGLILFTLVIDRQSSFAFAQRLRLAADQTLIIRTTCTTAFKDEVSRLPGVSAAVCSNTGALNYERFGWSFKRTDGTSLLVDRVAVDPGFFEVFDLRPLAGTLDTKERASSSRVVLNETAVRQLGFRAAQEAVGKIIACQSFPGFDCAAIYKFPNGGAEVVAVIPDFAVDAVHTAVNPAAYAYDPSQFQLLSVKLAGSRIPETLEAIDRLWTEVGEPKAIVRTFLDQRVQDVYLDITSQSQFFTVFSAIAVLVAGLGLFGLSAFTAETRTKEIGIRKSMGATHREILKLLLWQFTKPVLVANLIAWPVGYIVMQRWLEGFAYHVDLSPWIFLAASAMALLIAILTVFGHALLVARAQPVNALRYE